MAGRLRMTAMERNRRGGPALRRFREAVCFGCALALWLTAWRLQSNGFSGRGGHMVLAAIAVVEGVSLAVLFWREQSSRRERLTPWITLAWASLPAWFALELLAGSLLGGR